MVIKSGKRKSKTNGCSIYFDGLFQKLKTFDEKKFLHFMGAYGILKSVME